MTNLEHRVDVALASLKKPEAQPPASSTPPKWTRALAAKAKAVLAALPRRRMDAPPDGYHVDHKVSPERGLSSGFFWWGPETERNKRPDGGPFNSWSRANRDAWKHWSRKEARK